MKVIILALVVVAVFAQVVVSQQHKIILDDVDYRFVYYSTTLIHGGKYVLAASRVLDPKRPLIARIELTNVQSGYTTVVWSSFNYELLTMQLSESPYFAVSHLQTPRTSNYSLEVHATYAQGDSTILWSIFTTEVVAIRIAKTRPVITTAIVTADGGSELVWYNTQTGKKIGSWMSPFHWIQSAGWQLSDDGTIFAFWEAFSFIVVDISSNAKILLNYYGGGKFVPSGMALSPSGRTLFTTSYGDYKIFTYSASSGEFQLSMAGNLDLNVLSAIAAVTDSYLVVGCENSLKQQIGVKVYSVKSPQPLWQYWLKNTNTDWPQQIKISDDEELFSVAFYGRQYGIKSPTQMVFNMNGGLVWNYTSDGPMISTDIISPQQGQYLVSTCGHHSYHTPNYYQGEIFVTQIQFSNTTQF